MDGFKKFVLKGNLVDLAVAFIIGTAFAAVVKAFTDVVLGFVSRVFGGSPNFDYITIWKDDEGVGIPIGTFITATISFLILVSVASTAGYMTPMATPANALVIGEVRGIRFGRLVLLGLVLDVLVAGILAFWGITVMPFIL